MLSISFPLTKVEQIDTQLSQPEAMIGVVFADGDHLHLIPDVFVPVIKTHWCCTLTE